MLSSAMLGRTTILSAVVVVFLAGLSTPSDAAKIRCTIKGTAAADELVGTEGPDVICGLGGNDTIDGLGGNDIILADAGADQVDGGDGNDQIYGGLGNDALSGGSGNDVILAEAGNDLLLGDAGADQLNGGKGTNSCGASADTGDTSVTSCSYDIQGPEFVSLATSASAVGPGSVFRITLRARDISGVDRLGVMFMVGGHQNDFCGQDGFELTSGTILDGTWVKTCDVPLSVQNGTYEIVPYAEDRVLNWTNSNGGTESAIRGAFVVAGGSDDALGPEVVTLTVSSSTVSPGTTFTIAAHITDPSGVVLSGFWFELSGVGQRDFCGQTLTLVSGDQYDGTWTNVCTVPAIAINGNYTISPYTKDSIGNWTNSNGGRDDDTRASFTLSGGTDDVAGPDITSITVSDDTLVPGQEVVISMTTTDVTGVDFVAMWMELVGVGQRDICEQGGFTQTSGSATSGTWTKTCTIPLAVTFGQYVIRPWGGDLAGNWTNTNGGTADDASVSVTVGAA